MNFFICRNEWCSTSRSLLLLAWSWRIVSRFLLCNVLLRVRPCPSFCGVVDVFCCFSSPFHFPNLWYFDISWLRTRQCWTCTTIRSRRYKARTISFLIFLHIFLLIWSKCVRQDFQVPSARMTAFFFGKKPFQSLFSVFWSPVSHVENFHCRYDRVPVVKLLRKIQPLFSWKTGIGMSSLRL